MTNIGIKSSQLTDIRSALLETSKNNTLEPKSNDGFGNQIKDALDSVANAQESSKVLAQNFELGRTRFNKSYGKSEYFFFSLSDDLKC